MKKNVMIGLGILAALGILWYLATQKPPYRGDYARYQVQSTHN